MEDGNNDKEQRRRPCGEGDGLRTGVGDELPAVGSQALVHAVEAARVSSRRAQARYGLCTRMKDEGCEHKDDVSKRQRSLLAWRWCWSQKAVSNAADQRAGG
jgi:hypothetical protein